MQENEVNMLVSCLKQSKEHISDPMLLPVFLLELKVHYFALLLEKRAVGIERIEYSTGMRHGFSNRLIDKERREKLKTLDFHSITQKLTGVTGTLSFCDMTFKSSRTALELIASLRGSIAFDCTAPDTEQTTHSERALDRRIEYLRELITGSQALGDVLDARTKAQVQTVYSLIGQRDNKLNIETAEASRRIAILTRRDSTDMRLIAGVTLVFLPGTFIATIFGSNLFKFIRDGSSQVVSNWIWLYWALTIAVTIVVLAFWWQFSRRQRITSDLEKGFSTSAKDTEQPGGLEKQTSELSGAQIAALALDRSRSRSVGSVGAVGPYGVYDTVDKTG